MFYNDDQISRQMPGKKDCVSMKIEGVKSLVQKRLILCTEYEAFLAFKEKYPDFKIGFSKFADCKPKNVVLPGSSGTHNVCVCCYHQNPKLMIQQSKISTAIDFKKIINRDFENIEEEYSGEIKYGHLVARLMCNPPKIECWFTRCGVCKKFAEDLRDDILTIFGELHVEEVNFKQWVSTDRTELLSSCLGVEEFTSSLIEKVSILKTHMFIDAEQSSFFRQYKTNLQEGMVLAVGDFSENYSFIMQDAIQGVHWSNSQVTLHPWICYYNVNGSLQTLSVLFISDCLNHNTVSVYTFQKHLVQLLKKTLDLKHILYFSDGCSKQYKNKKNFLNIALHEKDFGIPADWGFSATSHGKGPWDGLAGAVKRQAALESLKRSSDDPIQTPKQFYEFAKKRFKFPIIFVEKEEVQQIEEAMLIERFKYAKLIEGTLKYHYFCSIPNDFSKLRVFEYSNATEFFIKRVSKIRETQV